MALAGLLMGYIQLGLFVLFLIIAILAILFFIPAGVS
jgi:hypothetical protein